MQTFELHCKLAQNWPMSSVKNNTKRGTSGTKGKQKTTDLATLVQRFYYLDDVLVALSSKWDTQKVGKN